MNIAVKKSYAGCDIVFEFDNAKFTEDVESVIYHKGDDGKIDFSKTERDIDTEAISQFSSALGEIVYYRKKDFDSSDLIELLFEKLPEAKRTTLVELINEKYT